MEAKPIVSDRWKALLRVVFETRASISHLAQLAQNGKDETRMLNDDWKDASKELAELLDEAGLPELAEYSREGS